MPKAPAEKREKNLNPVTKLITFNVHRALLGYRSKQRAGRAIREIKKYVAKDLQVEHVTIDPKLNVKLWEGGIRHIPHRLRLKVIRKRSVVDSKDNKEQMIAVVDVPDTDEGTKGLPTVKTE
jgi:large subunit ribosomal protein L31e